MRKHFLLAGLLLSLSPIAEVHAALPYSVTLRNYFGTMTFPRSVQMIPYPGEDSAFVIVQQAGKLMTVRRVNSAWVKTDSASITVLNGNSGTSEQGLLGFTFHPNFRQNRKYYAYYIATGATNGYDQLVERTMDSTLRPHSGDAQRTILRLLDPYNNHNSGTIKFGSDGYLYFALGDGGSGGDPQSRAQNLDSLFGKFMRFDVDGADAFPSDSTKNYAIPADNPFVGSGRPEIWAYGVRNPFRWTFHPVTGEIWVGDVGQDYREEVSHVTKGANMGWKIMEANTCYNPASGGSPLSSCSNAGMVLPVLTTLRAKGQSITGGDFFFGNPACAYHGVYFYGDYASDSLWAARIVSDSATEKIRIGSLNGVASFNLDNQGRIFAVSMDNGTINILESPDMTAAPVSLRANKRTGFRPLRTEELLRNPAAFELRGLDGRTLHAPGAGAGAGIRSGVAWARKKNSQGPAQLVVIP